MMNFIGSPLHTGVHVSFVNLHNNLYLVLSKMLKKVLCSKLRHLIQCKSILLLSLSCQCQFSCDSDIIHAIHVNLVKSGDLQIE